MPDVVLFIDTCLAFLMFGAAGAVAAAGQPRPSRCRSLRRLARIL